MKMQKTDIGVVGFMYAVCALFFFYSNGLKKEAQLYPRFIILLLFGLTTGYLIQMIAAAKKHGVTSGIAEIFEGFQAKQFFVILGLLVAYLVGIYFVGFWIATPVLMVASLLFLKVPKWQILLSTVAILLLVYCAFVLFLNVKLPAGLLGKLLK